MPKVPKVAIVTRTCNRTGLLRRAIESVLGQSMPDWQHVIVNDGGEPDEVDALCAPFEDAYKGRLKILHLNHAGMQAASNEAISASESTYIAIHDDDDAWHKDFLKQTTAYLDEQGAKSIYQGVISKTIRILEEEQADGSFKEVDRQPYVPLDEISLSRIGYENPFPPIAFLYRRKIHGEIGTFDPQWDLVADLDFNFRFLQRYEIGVVDEVLAHYHWRTGSAGNENANTVTVSKRRHAQLLNELKNHYFRQVDTIEGSARALAFLVSSFAVENQWMTGEIRERAKGFESTLAELAEKLQALQAFNEDSTWPKLDTLVSKADAGMEAIVALQNALPEKLEQIGEKLGSSLEKSQLESDRIASQTMHSLASLSSSIENINSAVAGITASVKGLGEGNQLLGKQVKALDDKSQSAAEEIQALREEVQALRSESRRQWQLGPLRMQWLKRAPEPGANDAES